MAYNWAQLAFVERWRHNAVRGPLVGMYRPADKTYFDVRLRPGEGNTGAIRGTVELHLVDAGDIIREKRIALLETRSVIVRVTATSAPPPVGSGAEPGTLRGRRCLEPGSKVSGKVLQVEAETALIDVGFPLVAQLPEGQISGVSPGQQMEIEVSETPKGFLVV